MRILIVEDEAYAAKNLVRKLLSVMPEAEVIGIIPDVKSGVQWFNDNEAPDLILSDIQLADGLSFDLYRQIGVGTPIIFTTAFDQYAIEAFELNSVNYLLKPIQEADLRRSLDKYETMRSEFSSSDFEKFSSFVTGGHSRSRILVYHGEDIIPVQLDEIAYFHSHAGECRLVTLEGADYSVTESLDALEKELEGEGFYRANRQFLIAASAIQKVKQHFNRKLKLILQPTKEELFVSKEKVSEFKVWLAG